MACQPVLITIDVTEDGKKDNVLKNKLERVNPLCSFRIMFNEATENIELDDLTVFASPTLTRGDEVEVNCDETLSFVQELFTVKSIYMHGTKTGQSSTEDFVVEGPDAWDVLMKPTNRVLEPMKGETMKIKLHNDVLADMQSASPLLRGRVVPSEAEKILKKVTDAIWYLDGRKQTINETSRKRKQGEIIQTPPRFEKYSDYQNWKGWKKKPKLESSECELHASALISAVESTKIAWPREWKEDIVTLSSSLSSYVKELRGANDLQKKRQSTLHPIRQLHDHATGQYWPCVQNDKVPADLKQLSDFMESCNEFEPILLDDEHFRSDITPSQRYEVLRNVALTVPVQVVRYDSGGGASVLVFMQKVPALFSENDKLTHFMKMLGIIEPLVPVYHTRAMRNKFTREIGVLNSTDVKPHVLRHVYRTLTGDSSKEIDCMEIDNRVRLAIETEDPDLVTDLRHLNKGRPADTFDLFFKELAIHVEQLTAVDDRRHGIAHMSDFISIRDLISRVREKLPEGTPIPTEATVIHSFAPPNMHGKSSQYYTGKINLKFVVQRRQLRAFHVDAHWCNALYLYFRELIVMRRSDVVFVSCDDKAKVDFGEPGNVISSGVRGKKSIVPTTTTLGALDHDVKQKGSIVPSVTLICDIPGDVATSFYRGQVNVTMKESVFQPSDSYRAILELINTLEENRIDWNEKKQLFLMTDGGPEHRVNYESVKIPLIMMFKKLNLDFLCAIRSAPGHSYINVVERIMSILNLGFQNVALQREESPSDDLIEKCKNLEELRKKPEIKTDWQKSVQSLISLLQKRVERLVLKDVPFKTTPAATDEQLEDFIEDTAEIDEMLPAKKQNKKLQKTDVKECESYQTFLSTHCKSNHYSFQIRRCDDASCCPGESSESPIPWLPHPIPDKANAGHYMKFTEVYGKEPTDEHIPSILNDIRRVAEEVQGCKSSALTAQNVRSTVSCRICKKIRCVYASRKLSNREINELKRVITQFEYICGCMIAPESSFLVGTVFTRLELHCGAPMEYMYYGASKVPVRKDLCAHCGKPRATTDAELKKSYKTVLPICDICKGRGKQVVKKGEIKSAAANKAKKAAAKK